MHGFYQITVVHPSSLCTAYHHHHLLRTLGLGSAKAVVKKGMHQKLCALENVFQKEGNSQVAFVICIETVWLVLVCIAEYTPQLLVKVLNN